MLPAAKAGIDMLVQNCLCRDTMRQPKALHPENQEQNSFSFGGSQGIGIGASVQGRLCVDSVASIARFHNVLSPMRQGKQRSIAAAKARSTPVVV